MLARVGQGSKVPADHLYDTILSLTGHGHPNSIHYNSRLPAGNYAQFCVRFGRFVFDPAMRRVESPREIVRVDSPRPVWWERSVRRLTDGGAEYRVIHLINPPVMPEIEANPDSRLPDPIGPVQVATRLPAGAPPARAFLLTAEALRCGDPPRTQAVPLEVKVNDGWATVTVPELLYWKMVVWRLGG